MRQLDDLIRTQNHFGDSITAHGVTLTPQSQAISVRWPNGGGVWNRPLAVSVERDGETERIPIVDVTRVAQLIFYALSVMFSLLTLIHFIRGRR